MNSPVWLCRRCGSIINRNRCGRGMYAHVKNSSPRLLVPLRVKQKTAMKVDETRHKAAAKSYARLAERCYGYVSLSCDIIYGKSFEWEKFCNFSANRVISFPLELLAVYSIWWVWPDAP